MKKPVAFIICFFISSIIIAQSSIDIDSTIIRPNIVWIVCEDMSPHLSCFGETEIKTPHLDALAKDGVMYTNAYTVAGVCAPSRCGIITGMYPTAIGGDNMRNYAPGKNANKAIESRPLPSYSIMPPPYVKCFTEYLRMDNYYCTNNSKEDYQFEAPVTAWDESSSKAHWKNRPEGKPFFAVFNLIVTHESRVWMRDSLPLLVDPAKVTVPPYYPDVPEVRHDIARNLSNIIEMDRQAGEIIQQLKDEGLYDQTIIFFYSDHGDGLPYVKREVLKRGLHIPLIIKFPRNANAGKTDDQFISGIDLGPTVLSLAGVTVPQYMQGQPFLGTQHAPSQRHYIFATKDRMGGEVDRIRTVYDGRYQYIRNYMPEKSWYQDITYRLQQPMMEKMIEMRDKGQLTKEQMRWFTNPKPLEELYDTQQDPYELTNLAENPVHKEKLQTLRDVYDKWYEATGDWNAMPEDELVKKMWQGKSKAPVTAKPTLKKVPDGYIIHCATPGASIGYIIRSKDDLEKKEGPWKVYRYECLELKKGDTISVRAQRIGYISSELLYTIAKSNK